MALKSLLLVVAITQGRSATANSKSYDLSHLLTPQLRFEINLIIPDSSFDMFPSLPAPMLESLEFLVVNQVPFRLLYNSTKKLPPEVTARSSRYIQNQVTHLIFVTIRSKNQRVDLYDVLVSCKLGTNLVLQHTIRESYIDLIVDQTAVNGRFELGFHPNIQPHSVPLNFLVFQWSGIGFLSPHASLVRETCRCDDGSFMKPLTDVFTLINAANGMKNLAQVIRNEKRNFRGRAATFCAPPSTYGSWNGFWKHILNPFRFRLAHRWRSHAFGGLLDTFIHAHNFTFLTLNCATTRRPWARAGTIHKRTTYWCPLPIHLCRNPAVALAEFSYQCVLWFSKPMMPPPYKLSSVTLPFSGDIVAPLALLGSFGLVMLILMERTGRWDPILASLSIFASITSKSLSLRRNSRYMTWYTAWLLLIGFILTSYINILQSVVIVPSVYHSDRSLDDMIRENFTFEAFNFKWIKAYMKKEPTTSPSVGFSGTELNSKILKMQEQLAKMVAEYKVLIPFNYHEFFKKYREGQRRVLVMSNGDLKFEEGHPTKNGWNVVIGQEQLFKRPHWWDFERVARASILVKSLRRFMQVGLVPYFLQLWDSITLKFDAAARKDLIAAGESDEARDSVGNLSRITLKDGLVSESFVLFQYGMSLAVAGFVCEVIATLVTLLALPLRHRIVAHERVWLDSCRLMLRGDVVKRSRQLRIEHEG